MEQLAT